MSDARHPNVMFGGWFQVRPKVYACAPAKCGSQSLKQAAFGVHRVAQVLELRKKRLALGEHDIGPYTPWEVAERKGRKVLGIRGPVDRFAALWRDKCRQPDRTRHHVRLELAGMTPAALIERVESMPFRDSHWFPQAVYLVPDVELVRFDRLHEALGLEPVRINSRANVETPPLPAGRIRAHYAADVRLWESVQ